MGGIRTEALPPIMMAIAALRRDVKRKKLSKKLGERSQTRARAPKTPNSIAPGLLPATYKKTLKRTKEVNLINTIGQHLVLNHRSNKAEK